MLSVAKAKKDYYLKKLGEVSPGEDYYLRGGTAAGTWRGRGAAEIGLAGRVSAEGLVRLFDGKHPGTGEQLGRSLRKDGVAAWDLTFSADKSVSLLWALGDVEVQRQVREAFDEATGVALDYIEAVASSTRGGRKTPVLDTEGRPVLDEEGRPRVRVETWPIETSGYLAAAFTEFTSRADDPQLHTHVVVGNRVKGVDGVWRTLDGQLLYRHKMAAGAIHEAELRSRLTQRLGVRWQPVDRGLADIEGFTEDQIVAFSRRRTQIEEWRDQNGLADTAAVNAQGALATRAAKHDRPIADLVTEWQERAVGVGLTPMVIAGMLDRSRLVTVPDPAPVVAGFLSETGLTAEVSTFGRPEVIQQVAAHMPEGGTRPQIEAVADQFLTDDEVVLLVPDRNESRYTTADLLSTERRIINRAIDGVGAGRWTAKESLVTEALERHSRLNEGQRDLVSQFATSGSSIDVGAGPAGTGKSAALAVIRELAEATGTPILGTALAARAAAGFEADTDIPSITLTRLFGRALEQGLLEGVIVVVDEAGMVGSRQLARLSDLVEQASGKLILIGDHCQLPEIEAGGLFRALTQRLPAVILTENVRQTEGWERAALTELRNGEASRAVGMYRENGRIVTTDCPIEAVELAVENWHHDVEVVGDISQVLLIAYRNTTVNQLNQQARSRIDQAGRLQGPALAAGEQVFQAGDRVVCHRNRHSIGVVNGDLATIEAVDSERHTVTVRLDRNNQTRTIPIWYLDDGYLDYGYAITGHKAQGATTRIVHTVAEAGADREWIYVTMSRGRDSNTLYLVEPGTPNDDCNHLTHDTRHLDPITASLNRRRAKTAAIDMLTMSR